MNTKKIMVLGDTHGEFHKANKAIEKENPDIILQVGDLGYWPKWPEYSLNKLKLKNSKLYFCDGNHEDHESLRKIREDNNNKLEPIEVHENIYYCPRGTVVNINDKNFLFFGGARSIDGKLRIVGNDYFPFLEKPNQQELLPIIDMKNGDIHTVISHTCPFVINEYLAVTKNTYLEYDDSTRYLQIILEHLSPARWFFGHFHDIFAMTDVHEKTIWQCLGIASEYKNIGYTIID